MANNVGEWSATAASNTSLGAVSLQENIMLVNAVNNAFRELMAQVATGISANAFMGAYTPASASAAASLQFPEDTDNGAHKVTLSAPAALSGDIAVTLPSSAGTLALTTDAAYPSGHLYGLTLSNNGTDATNDIDIAAGTARDGGDTANMALASALTKKLDAAWAVGTNQGMLDGTESVAGTPDTSTWYHIWLIKRPDTGVVDVLASESATAPTMPTNYTLKVWIGAVYNDSSGDIKAFTQAGRRFYWTTAAQDASARSIGATAELLSLTVPSGFKVEAFFDCIARNSGAAISFRISSPDQSDDAAGLTTASLVTAAAAAYAGGQFSRRTNTSGQIRFRADTASSEYWVHTYGWEAIV